VQIEANKKMLHLLHFLHSRISESKSVGDVADVGEFEWVKYFLWHFSKFFHKKSKKAGFKKHMISSYVIFSSSRDGDGNRPIPDDLPGGFRLADAP